MTPQELKASILQLAIQGKLVEQRLEEGTGEELYQQIQQEKQKLIKAGKIKKEKPLPEISEDEKPFEIPESWKWIRWGSVVNVVSARRVHQCDWKTSGIPFYRAREIAKLSEEGYVDNELFISQELFEQFSESGVPQVGDLMVTAVGTLGKTYIVKPNDRFYYKDASVICLENYGKLIPEFLKYIMQSDMMMSQVRSNSGGTTVATLTMVRMVEYIMPLPPLAEQKRIVAKIEELLPYIDRYEQAWSRLEAFNKRFPVDMQKSILQMAIQGKLVEQRPEEGKGEELYQQIQQEKQKLIKAGKTKKEKPLPEISEDEKPFEIPESWKWVRFSEVIDVRDGTHDTPKYVLDGVPLVTSKNLVDGKIDFSTTKMISYEDAKEINMRSAVDDGDILYAMIGTIGNPVLVSKDREFCVKNMALFKAYDQELFDMRYLKLFLFNEQHIMKKKASGGVQAFVSLKFLRNYLLPLPPLAEQKRIVAKLEEILPLCERLK